MTTTLGEAVVYEASSITTVDAQNPWPGLESFREEDVAFFKGRDAEADELRQFVERERLTVLYGLSGLGKSSLFQAGLFPRARSEGLLPIYIRLRHDDDAPPLRAQVLQFIADSAARHRVDAPHGEPRLTLWEHFHRDGQGYWQASPEGEQRQLTPLLVFDQFEEFFTLGAQERQAVSDAFLDDFADLVEGRVPSTVRSRLSVGELDRTTFSFNRHNYKILIGIREDFLADLETLGARSRMPSVMANRMRLSPLKGDSALLVTAAGGHALVSESVGEQIVRRLAGDEANGRELLATLIVDPALLSLLCRELNERRKVLGRPAITADLLEGSREQILADYYTRSLLGLGAAAQHLIEEQLITVGGHRNSEAEENALARPGVTTTAIERLIGLRILRREEREGHARLELTHDVLTGVVRQSRDRRRAEEEAAAQTRAQLLRAEELARAARRSRLVISALSGAVVIVLVIATIAVREAVKANTAVRLEKASDSLKALVQDSLSRANKLRERDRVQHDSVIAQKNDSLSRSLAALNAKGDSVQLAQKEAMVTGEINQNFLKMVAAVVTRRIAADSALNETAKVDIDSAANIRKEAIRIDSVNARHVAIVDSVLCGRNAGNGNDSLTVRRLRLIIQQRLTDAKIATSALCGQAERIDRRAP